MTRVLRSTHVRLVATVLVAALALTALIGRDDQAGAVGSDVDVVYVADGRGFADALVGSVLAAMNNAPLLTVEGARHGDEIPPDTVDELNRLKPIDKIRVFGGSVAISDDVLNQLAGFTTGGDAARISGGTRYDTAAAIAQALPEMTKNADMLDGEQGSHYLGRSNHTGTQPPGTIDPQGDGSGLDADQLDGNEATDFLGATDQAVDSDKLDGIDAEAYRRIGINVFGAFVRDGAGFDDNVNGGDAHTGITLPDSGTPTFSFNFRVPDDYPAGGDFTVKVLLNTPASSCTVQLEGSFAHYMRDGSTPLDKGGTAAGGFSSDAPSGEIDMPATATESVEQTFTLNLPSTSSDTLMPGDAVTFGIFRRASSDTCADTAYIQNVDVTY